MTDEFYEWLDECPVKWFRINEDHGGASYVFLKDDEEEDNEPSSK